MSLTDWITACASVVVALGTLGLVFYTARQLRQQGEALREAAEFSKQERDQSRANEHARFHEELRFRTFGAPSDRLRRVVTFIHYLNEESMSIEEIGDSPD